MIYFVTPESEMLTNVWWGEKEERREGSKKTGNMVLRDIRYRTSLQCKAARCWVPVNTAIMHYLLSSRILNCNQSESDTDLLWTRGVIVVHCFTGTTQQRP